jgi:hypothetical protein
MANTKHLLHHDQEGFNLKYERMIKHLQIISCNQSHQQVEEEKNYMIISTDTEALDGKL